MSIPKAILMTTIMMAIHEAVKSSLTEMSPEPKILISAAGPGAKRNQTTEKNYLITTALRNAKIVDPFVLLQNGTGSWVVRAGTIPIWTTLMMKRRLFKRRRWRHAGEFANQTPESFDTMKLSLHFNLFLTKNLLILKGKTKRTQPFSVPQNLP